MEIVALLPTLTLFAMMLAMGMTLEPRDFARLLRTPTAFALGAFGQLVLLPAVAFALASALELGHTLGVGLMLIAACPGGVTSNALAHYARGDAALSISLTAFSSVVAFLTIPLVVGFGLSAFADTSRAIALPFAGTAATILSTTALPVALGMLVRRVRPRTAARWHRPLLAISTSLLLLLIAGLGTSLWSSEEDMSGLFRRAAPAVAALIALMTAAGLVGARALRLPGPQARTIAIEIGIQNFNLALVVGMTILREPLYVGAALVYLPMMFVFTGGVIAADRLQRRLLGRPTTA